MWYSSSSAAALSIRNWRTSRFQKAKIESTRPSLVGEVQAAVLVAGHLTIEEVEALVAEFAAGMVVDGVEDDGDAVDMEQVDDGHQLRCLALEGGRLGAAASPFATSNRLASAT